MPFNRGTATKGSRISIPLLFSAKVATLLDHHTQFMSCVNTDWEGELMNAGDLITIEKFGDIAWNTYTPYSTSITYATMSEDGFDLVLDQINYAAFKQETVEKQLENIDHMDGYAERLAISGREKVDTHLYTGLTAAVPSGNTMGAATTGSVIGLTKDNIYPVFCDLYAILDDAKVFGATTQMPWTVVPPRIHSLMRQSGEFTSAAEMNKEVMRTGALGEFAGFEVKSSTNSPLVPAGSGTDAYYNVLAGVNFAYTFAMNINMDEKLLLEGSFANGLRALMMYGSAASQANGLAKLVCNRAA